MGKRNIDKLSLIWDKRQNDFVFKYPRRCDGKLIGSHICGDILRHVMPWEKAPPYNFEKTNFAEELERRGYDLTTLRFSIELKEENSVKEKP